KKIESAEHVDVAFLQSAESGAQPGAMVEARIARAITALTSAIFAVVSDSDDAKLDESQVRRMLDREKPVRLDVRFAGRRQVPTGFDQSVPGYVVMFVLMNLLIFGGLAISQERVNGVLRRLAAQPVSKSQVIVGKILGRFLLGVVQIVYLLMVSRFLFGMDYAGNLPLITLTILVFAWGCASLGVFIGAVVKTPESVQGICTLGSVAMAALGGCWWPLEIVPDFARRIGQLFPTAWAMSAMHQLISFGGGFADIQHELILIAGFALVATALAARFLRFA
ncbi:MAG: ABC transporter permease, partial [Planctomycetota bacterium]